MQIIVVKLPLPLTAVIALTSCGSAETAPPAPPDQDSAVGATSNDAGSNIPASREDTETSAAGPTTAPRDADYVGRWDRPDGGYLVVTDPPTGGMVLEFRDGGVEQRYVGSVTAEGLRYMRDGKAEAAIPFPGTAGSDFGCLSISESEMYCRS